MGVIKISQTLKTQVTPSRMFKAVVLDSHNLCPKLMPSLIKSIEFIEGDGEVGSIKQMNFTEAIPFRYVKHRIDVLDKENFTSKYTLIEGDDVVTDKLESITYGFKFDKYGYSGCVCKISCEYKTKENVEINEEELQLGKGISIAMCEAVQGYLMAHPHAYT